MKIVGVLALQGDFEAHCRALESVGARSVEVRSAAELEACDGLVIPGGESSSMLKLIEIEDLTRAILDFGASKPIYGTCAGAILLAKQVTHPEQYSFGLLDIDVQRNGYGRQIDSRVVKISRADGSVAEAVFIRAPIIRRVGPGVRVLATYNGDPVWVQEGQHMVTTFHPELSTDRSIHKYFVENLGRPQ